MIARGDHQPANHAAPRRFSRHIFLRQSTERARKLIERTLPDTLHQGRERQAGISQQAAQAVLGDGREIGDKLLELRLADSRPLLLLEVIDEARAPARQWTLPV